MVPHNKKVILSMPEPGAWTFMSFVTESGRDVAEEWDTVRDFEADSAFKTMIKMNRKTKNYTDWPAWRHKMQREAGKEGVVELGFKASGRPYRILCKFNGKMCIVILCVSYHKGSIWTPAKAVEIATERAKLVAIGKATLNVIKDEDDI
jgi:putative component of toxin-antitoxin plasmid stabilization module